jgi:hypothetical protein
MVKRCNVVLRVKRCNIVLRVKRCNIVLRVKRCNRVLRVKRCNAVLRVKRCNIVLRVKRCNIVLRVKRCNILELPAPELKTLLSFKSLINFYSTWSTNCRGLAFSVLQFLIFIFKHQKYLALKKMFLSTRISH